MPERIDVHTHLLPGRDDGCKTFNESLACARMLVDAGYAQAFCTPHILPLFPENTVANVLKATAELQAVLDEHKVPLRVSPGGEITLTAMWPALQEMSLQEIPTYGMQGRHVLIDFWADALPDCFEAAVAHLQSLGLTVILAHPERAAAFQRDPELVQYVQNLGVRLQGNLQCLADPPDTLTRALAEHYLRKGHYYLLGSDCHIPGSLPVRLNGLQAAIRMVGEERVRELTVDHPRELFTAPGA